MSATLLLDIGWANVVREGEADAVRLMDAAGMHRWDLRGFNEDAAGVQQRQLDAFGATAEEFDEMMADLTERYRRMPLWRRRARRSILHDYARLRGFTTAIEGLTVTWR